MRLPPLDSSRSSLTLLLVDRKTEEYELAPAWKRYTFASGFVVVALGIVSWGALAPARIITKLTLRRPLSPTTRAHFHSESIVGIHTPITSLPFLSPRAVPLSKIHLLGPLSNHPQPYHPASGPTQPASAPQSGVRPPSPSQPSLTLHRSSSLPDSPPSAAPSSPLHAPPSLVPGALVAPLTLLS